VEERIARGSFAVKMPGGKGVDRVEEGAGKYPFSWMELPKLGKGQA